MGDSKHDIEPQLVNMYVWAWNSGLVIVLEASDVCI